MIAIVHQRSDSLVFEHDAQHGAVLACYRLRENGDFQPRAFSRPDSDCGDAIDTVEQNLCQQPGSASDSRSNGRHAIEALVCMVFVQTTIALH